MIQANVLTPVSQVANIVGNIVNNPARGTAQTIAGITDALISAVTGKERAVLTPFGDIPAAIRGAGKGIRMLPGIMWRGTEGDILKPGGEVSRGFHPFRAFLQFWTGTGLAFDPKTGRVSWNDRMKRAFESTFGVPAEIMFRGLSAGDRPFYHAFYGQYLSEIGRLKGLKGEALRSFMQAPDADSKALAEERAKHDVYQGENLAGRLVSTLEHEIDLKGPMGEWINTLLTKVTMLFVKTPSNILWEADQFLNPVHGVFSMIFHVSRGARREALLAYGRMVTGMMMYAAAFTLARLGITTPAPAEDKKRKSMQYGTGRTPLRLNMDLLNRVWPDILDPDATVDLSWRDGDRLVDYRNLGYFGLVLNVVATGRADWIYNAHKAGKPLDEDAWRGMAEIFSTAGLRYPTALMDLSMLKGTANLLDAVRQREYENWFVKHMETISSVAIPNTVKALNRSIATWMPEVRVAGPGTTLQAIGNMLKVKTFRGTSLPIRRGYFGRKIPQTPGGANPWLYHLASVTKTMKTKIRPVDAMVWDTYSSTLDSRAIPTIPSPVIQPPEAYARQRPAARPVVLEPHEYERYLEQIGQLRLQSVEAWMDSPEWDEISLLDRVRLLDRIYSDAYRRVHDPLVRRYIESGRYLAR